MDTPVGGPPESGAGRPRERRLFVALAVPAPLGRRLLARTRRDLGREARAGVRFPRATGLHLTLAFLGPVAEPLAGRLGDALEDGVGGLAAPRLALEHTGAFPQRGRERVLWVAPVEEPGAAGRLAALHAAVAAALARAGWRAPRDGRDQPFHPHVTLGRIRATRIRGDRRRGAREPRRAPVPEAFYARAHAEAWCPLAVQLVESRLDRPGDRYRALATVPLAGTLPGDG